MVLGSPREEVRERSGVILGGLGASLEALWGVWDGLWGEFVDLGSTPLALGGLGRSWGTLWDAFAALEDLQETQKVTFLERCHVDMRSKQMLMRF